MRRDLLALARANGGLITRADVLRREPRHVIDDALNDGVLVGLHPGVYVLADAVRDRRLLRRAALAYLPKAALSHLDALELWGVGPAGSRIHLTAPSAQRAITSPTLIVHRRRGFVAEPPAVVLRQGLRVVRLERALVDSWRLINQVDRRAPLIDALRDRRTTQTRLTATLDESPRLPGTAEMRRLIALVAAGCHSELEIWGHDRIFSDPRLPQSHRQHAIHTGGRRMFLDRYFPVERVAVELDGAAWHGRPEQRERDLRRDATLFATGILVVRYSHRRLSTEPEAIIEELCAVLMHRRAQAM